jgi:hypothetical protein
MNKHLLIFLRAFRTAILFMAGFISYEILQIIEKEWNNINPNNEVSNLYGRKIYHFLIIFICDLSILYLINILFGVHI